MLTAEKTKQVLIVDDNQQMADCLAEMVTTLGRRCRAVYDGKSAIKELNAGGYDLVVADTQMPEMNGFDLLKRIRKRHPKVRVALISTTDTLRTQKIILRDQPDFYLPKPFTSGDIAGLLAQL
ncbi:MAG: response regulator [bacterium]